MTLSIDRFDEFFQAADCKNRQPFPWQTRLANRVFNSGWPACIDLPTASGKTACIDVAVFVAACQANLPAEQQTVGRRVFFTVNRRAIVDEAFLRAKSLAERLRDAELNGKGILSEVACALRSLNEEASPSLAPPLAIAQLRGGVYRDATWARSLTQPIIVCTTVDQLGSRMLFRGYGVSDQSLPIHAALCTHDATIILDEAHVTKAFCETLELLKRYQSIRNDADAISTPFRYVQMTATPHGTIDQPFQLDEWDYQNPALKNRRKAEKAADLIVVDKKNSLADEISSEALRIGSATPRAVGIIVNRVQTARDIAKQIQSKLNDQKMENAVHLVIGRMRPIDRDKLQDELREIVGPDRPALLCKTVFVVATQCLEVGADYDFDALLTECASIDALRQRFGRLNRSGRLEKDEKPIRSVASIFFQESTEKGDDPIYGSAILATWNWMQQNKNGHGQINFGIEEFKKLWDEIGSENRNAMSSPSTHAAVLLPAHLDLLCQTSPRPTPEPDIGYFIHGPRRSNADVNVCWRADLGGDSELWPDIVRLLPPTSLECMAVPIWTIRRWIAGKQIDKQRDADVSVMDALEDPRKSEKTVSDAKTVLRWRGSGDQTIATCNSEDIRPGDTIVISVCDGGWEEFGHIPGFPPQSELTKLRDCSTDSVEGMLKRHNEIDIAEACCRLKNLRYIIRLHSAFPNRAALRSLPMSELRSELLALTEQELSNARSSKLLSSIKSVIVSAAERHNYPATTESLDSIAEADDSAFDEVICFRALLPNDSQLELPSPDHDDEEDDRSQSNGAVTLPVHTSHVVARVSQAILKLNESLASLCSLAAAWHDLGKADLRFQAMLSGLTPYETIERQSRLAKSDGRLLTKMERNAIRQRAMLPSRFRHEFLSSQLAENVLLRAEKRYDIDTDVVLRLIESHHGYARPFADVVMDLPASFDEASVSDFNELRSIFLRQSEHWPDVEVDGNVRDAFVPSHRLNSGVAERFWKLTRRFGWWGLAYLETTLRLADQQASATEERGRK